MLISAELRWFWRDACPEQLHRWFMTANPTPGGGLRARIDEYARGLGSSEIGLKTRDRAGVVPRFEIKGLVATTEMPQIPHFGARCELWCKWSCTLALAAGADTISTTKLRWLRKLDTSGPVAREVPLGQDEQPLTGERVAEGCNVELTRVEVAGDQNVWWTFCFEAFGSLDSAPLNLVKACRHHDAVAKLLTRGVKQSYPEWLLSLSAPRRPSA